MRINFTLTRAYNDIPFDQNLKPRQFAPTTTLESSADPVSQQAFSKKFELPAQEWQVRYIINLLMKLMLFFIANGKKSARLFRFEAGQF